MLLAMNLLLEISDFCRCKKPFFVSVVIINLQNIGFYNCVRWWSLYLMMSLKKADATKKIFLKAYMMVCMIKSLAALAFLNRKLGGEEQFCPHTPRNKVQKAHPE